MKSYFYMIANTILMQIYLAQEISQSAHGASADQSEFTITGRDIAKQLLPLCCFSNSPTQPLYPAMIIVRREYLAS